MEQRPKILENELLKLISPEEKILPTEIKSVEFNFEEIFDKAINQNIGLRALLKSSGLYDKFEIYIPRVFKVLNSTDEGKEILKELGVYTFIDKIK